ncbi:DUF1272 domain-containing protein [Nevskia ramosa]|uniref:DUF1272 domain-containing protein n=1 Tax=Nevskia ramosa TaxID=64002 RepID=UPI0023541B82|nr:DUF1272 domain-containing protein [Nevskia ramosa]
MLQLRPNCECCNRDLPPDSGQALICSFECTFCVDCGTQALQMRCPNCSGELLQRPRRPAAMLVQYPASTERVLKQGGCAKTA